MTSFNALLAVDPTLFERWPELARHYEAAKENKPLEASE
jgi:hypothetical protein